MVSGSSTFVILAVTVGFSVQSASLQREMTSTISKPKRADRYRFAYWGPPDTIVRSKAADESAVVATSIEPAVYRVFDMKPGWMHVRSLDDSVKGWIRMDTTDQEKSRFVARDPVLVLQRVVAGHEKNWPDAVILDVLHRRIRLGFSRDMVVSALGDPPRHVEDATPTGPAETLTFPDQVIVLRDGLAVRITTPCPKCKGR